MLPEHHVLYAGRFLLPDSAMSSLGLEQESCLHIVKRPAHMNPTPEDYAVPSGPLMSSAMLLSPACPPGVTPLLSAPITSPSPRPRTATDLEPYLPPAVAALAASPFRGTGALTAPSPREVRPTDVDTAIVPFKMTEVPSDVEFENGGLMTSTCGKWVTIMADMPGVSSGRFEWEIEVFPVAARCPVCVHAGLTPCVVADCS